MNRLKFNPTISFDGVAIILAVIGFSVWLGKMGSKVESHAETIKAHENQLREIITMTTALTTIVDERTRRPGYVPRVP